MPPVWFEPMTWWSSVSCSANWARKESVGDFWSELSFVSCTTSLVGLCLFLESIEHKGLNDSHPQPKSDLAQLDHTQGIFFTKFILFCVALDLSDNLTEMRIVKNSTVCYVLYWVLERRECLVWHFGMREAFNHDAWGKKLWKPKFQMDLSTKSIVYLLNTKLKRQC